MRKAVPEEYNLKWSDTKKSTGTKLEMERHDVDSR